MKKLKIPLLYDNVHFLFILIILLILSLRYWYFIPILIIFSIFLYKKTSLFYVGIILCVLILLSSVRYFYEFNDEVFNATVIDCNNKTATLYIKGVNVLVYHNNELELGDYGLFKVSKLDYDTELFNYSDYLENKDIKNYYKLISFEDKDNYFVIGKIREFFLEIVNKNPSKYKNYINMLVFAYNDNVDILDETNNLGISHIMAVSGMHVGLLVFFIEFILKKFFYYEKPIDLFISVFLLFYLFVTNFNLTVLRAVLMVLFKKLFKYLKMPFTSLDVLSFVGIFILLISPRYLFLLSFQLSFLVSFIIIIFANAFDIKNKIMQTYFVSLVAFLVTFPFIINTNYQINLLTIIIGPIYILFFELVLYPATLLISILPFTSIVLDYVFNFFELTIMYFDSIKFFNFVFGKVSAFSFILYEVILYFWLVSFEIKRGRSLLTMVMLLFLILLYNKALFNPFYKIKMYDVGQGDSILISLPYSAGNILVDCYNNVVDHLKCDGIKKIDLLFLSHGHNDHVGAFDDIMDNYDVKYIYSSYFDTTDELENIKKENKITLLKSGEKVIYNDFICEVLGPLKSYSNENDNSLVFKVYLADLTILFTGDIEQEAELDLVDKYHDNLKSDILKAAHHGSKTSSSKEFIKYVSPTFILISVGRNNKYNHPNNEYLLSIKNIIRTDVSYSITIYKRKKFFYIEK